MTNNESGGSGGENTLEDFNAAAEDHIVVPINGREYQFVKEDVPKLKVFFETLKIHE